MIKVKSICEAQTKDGFCANIAKGEFQRMGDECVGWHKNMSICLCKEHSKKHIPVDCAIRIIAGRLIIAIRAKHGFKLRVRRYRTKKKNMHLIAEKKGISVETIRRRLAKGHNLKEASKPTNHNKPVIMLDGTMREVKRFSSLQKAHEGTGITKTNIHRVIQGKRKTAGGYIFKYLKTA